MPGRCAQPLWGYDYRQDLKGELTEDYFLSVARRDFAARRAVNFAVRLDRQLIGEVVLYLSLIHI